MSQDLTPIYVVVGNSFTGEVATQKHEGVRLTAAVNHTMSLEYMGAPAWDTFVGAVIREDMADTLATEWQALYFRAQAEGAFLYPATV